MPMPPRRPPGKLLSPALGAGVASTPNTLSCLQGRSSSLKNRCHVRLCETERQAHSSISFQSRFALFFFRDSRNRGVPMLVQPDPPPSKPILKNPMVYSSIALAVVVLVAGADVLEPELLPLRHLVRFDEPGDPFPRLLVHRFRHGATRESRRHRWPRTADPANEGRARLPPVAAPSFRRPESGAPSRCRRAGSPGSRAPRP